MITSKAQTTIPQAVRVALGLHEGDEIAYSIEHGRIILTRAPVDRPDDPFHTFTEWDSDAAVAGLPAPSVVRTAKIAVIDARDAESLGTLPAADRTTTRSARSFHLSPCTTRTNGITALVRPGLRWTSNCGISGSRHPA